MNLEKGCGSGKGCVPGWVVYAGKGVSIDVLPRGPLTLLIIRSITIKQGIHTDGPENWPDSQWDNMSEMTTNGGDEDAWTSPFSNFSPKSGNQQEGLASPCEGFIASASIGSTTTLPAHDSIGRPTNLQCEDDDEDGDVKKRP